jgi:hypothetical protein
VTTGAGEFQLQFEIIPGDHEAHELLLVVFAPTRRAGARELRAVHRARIHEHTVRGTITISLSADELARGTPRDDPAVHTAEWERVDRLHALRYERARNVRARRAALRRALRERIPATILERPSGQRPLLRADRNAAIDQLQADARQQGVASVAASIRPPSMRLTGAQLRRLSVNPQRIGPRTAVDLRDLIGLVQDMYPSTLARASDDPRAILAAVERSVFEEIRDG